MNSKSYYAQWLSSKACISEADPVLLIIHYCCSVPIRSIYLASIIISINYLPPQLQGVVLRALLTQRAQEVGSKLKRYLRFLLKNKNKHYDHLKILGRLIKTPVEIESFQYFCKRPSHRYVGRVWFRNWAHDQSSTSLFCWLLKWCSGSSVALILIFEVGNKLHSGMRGLSRDLCSSGWSKFLLSGCDRFLIGFSKIIPDQRIWAFHDLSSTHFQRGYVNSRSSRVVRHRWAGSWAHRFGVFSPGFEPGFWQAPGAYPETWSWKPQVWPAPHEFQNHCLLFV